MKFTSALIIATYNWEKALNLVLLSVKNQTVLPSKIIIADDGSSIETKNLIESYRNQISTEILHIWQEDLGFRKSKILNKSIAVANVDYIIQVDGDCILHKKFIEDHLKNAIKNCYLYGSRVNIIEKYVSDVFIKNKIKFNFFSKEVKNKTRTIHSGLLAKTNTIETEYSDKFRGCNVSFWTKDFIVINGYNEAFEGWGREDSDLVIRMNNNGVMSKRLKFCAIVYHIFHPIKSRENFEKNDEIQNKTIQNKVTLIEKGINQYL